MKKLGKLVFMSEAEYWATLRRTSIDDDKMYTAGFNAGKWHSAGGYGKCLKETKAKLAGTTAVMLRFMDLAAKWRPLVESLETYPNQFVEIGFDAGLHFPVECVDKKGEHYTKMGLYGET